MAKPILNPGTRVSFQRTAYIGDGSVKTSVYTGPVAHDNGTVVWIQISEGRTYSVRRDRVQVINGTEVAHG